MVVIAAQPQSTRNEVKRGAFLFEKKSAAAVEVLEAEAMSASVRSELEATRNVENTSARKIIYHVTVTLSCPHG